MLRGEEARATGAVCFILGFMRVRTEVNGGPTIPVPSAFVIVEVGDKGAGERCRTDRFTNGVEATLTSLNDKGCVERNDSSYVGVSLGESGMVVEGEAARKASTVGEPYAKL